MPSEGEDRLAAHCHGAREQHRQDAPGQGGSGEPDGNGGGGHCEQAQQVYILMAAHPVRNHLNVYLVNECFLPNKS